MTTTTRSSDASVKRHLDIIEVKPGKRFSLGVLMDILPTAEHVLFFGKAYELDYVQLSSLMSQVLKSDLANVLFSGDHSTELQGYVCDVLADYDDLNEGDIVFDPEVPIGEILPEMWEGLEVEVAASIKAVAERLESVVGLLPGKQGKMLFESMMVMNRNRPVLGDYRAKIHHAPQKRNLLVLDVSGSMNASTIRAIVADVVALSYKADAALAIVSDYVTYWEPGGYDVDSVLGAATYGGTHYEQLVPVFQQDWGTVITVADYDSSASAKATLKRQCFGSIDTLLDISLVDRPTFLAECVGHMAAEIRPLLVANSSYVLT